MKKYLFGLGAMLVGAGLMFVLMHGEVSAEGEPKKPEPFVCTVSVVDGYSFTIQHCETKTMDCALTLHGVSCFNKGLFR